MKKRQETISHVLMLVLSLSGTVPYFVSWRHKLLVTIALAYLFGMFAAMIGHIDIASKKDLKFYFCSCIIKIQYPVSLRYLSATKPRRKITIRPQYCKIEKMFVYVP